jgi:hypothetical protein
MTPQAFSFRSTPLDILFSDGFDYLFPVDYQAKKQEAREIKLAEFDVLNSLIEE